MQRPTRIPLFPLDVVLLPSMPLPLHIFEPRYRVMVARCLSEKIEFGMIFTSSQSIATVGCTAEILRKMRDYPDGRMDILSEGRAVFRLAELLDEKEYYEGIVEYLDDAPLAFDPAREAHLLQAFEQCHTLLFGKAWLDARREESATLSYRMAALLPLEAEKKQALLEMRQESKRRETLSRWMETLLPKLAEAHRARQRHTLN